MGVTLDVWADVSMSWPVAPLIAKVSGNIASPIGRTVDSLGSDLRADRATNLSYVNTLDQALVRQIFRSVLDLDLG